MTFLKILKSSDVTNGNGNDEEDESGTDRAVTAMGILSTIETVLDMMEEEREITKQLEGIITPLIAHILKNRIMGKLDDDY